MLCTPGVGMGQFFDLFQPPILLEQLLVRGHSVLETFLRKLIGSRVRQILRLVDLGPFRAGLLFSAHGEQYLKYC